MGLQGGNNSTDQLHFQTQLLERLHNISPYQPQRSPYATPSPYAMGPQFLLPPNNRQANSAQLSPSNLSLRVSQPNSFTSSPVMSHKVENYGSAEGSELQQSQQSAFIKPLPCPSERAQQSVTQPVDTKSKQERCTGMHDEIPPIVLDPPPQGKRTDGTTKQLTTSLRPNSQGTEQKSAQQSKSLASMLRTPGPPPSRTTSARLPSRSDLMCEVQRTTWARHTTK